MPLSRFERFLPWTGLVAGLCWVGQASLSTVGTHDTPGGADAAVIRDHAVANTVSTAFVVLMAVAVVFFAAAVRERLRSGEAAASTCSSVAYAAWVTVAAALTQMALWRKALLAAAEDDDGATVTVLGYADFYGWLPLSVGLSAAFLATGLGGLRSAVLPRWFAVATVVLGGLALLGACSVPPGGLVGYLLLPFWLAAAAVVIARRLRQAAAARG